MWFNNSTPRYIPKNGKQVFKQKLVHQLFIAALFTIAQGRKDLNVHQQVNG